MVLLVVEPLPSAIKHATQTAHLMKNSSLQFAEIQQEFS
jgi:hypothetical protein